ncbi:MAG: VIT and VWA domain-containing protein [Pyrinomonadaceae bacterium]|nr:VIT and VWA domain-containing protein [Pyrinomonadaceae bacterium]
MKLKYLAALICIGLGAVFSAMPAAAQGVIVPIVCDLRPCRPIPRPIPLPNVLPVKSIKLDTKINGQVATAHVEQVFRNDTQHTLEGTYFFPIPENASISEFAIWENGKKLIGEVRTREEARRIYDEIVRRQRDPGLLEYAGKDLFQASIFPIPPNSDKKLEIKYTQVLKAESGTVSYRYPLGTGRNLWRNQWNGQEGVARNQVAQSFGTVSGTIEIMSKDPIRNVYSPSHSIDVRPKGENTTVVSFETRNNDSDLQLFYGLSSADFGVSLLTYREPGKEGYFLMTISPRDNIAERELVNKDIVFVLDTSGSMAEEGKMEKARSALLFGIRTLRDGDRFNVINFAGEEHLMERGLIKADAAGKRRGEEFVKGLQPNGGTNINDSLAASLKQFEKNDRPKMIVFMTDGLPTVGETNGDKIAANFAKAKNIDVRVFPFGFGYDVNTALLDKLGTENSGVSDYVQPKEDLEVKVSNFFAKVSSPVLSDLQLDLGDLEVEYMYPRKLGDLFKGMQLTVIGRYKNRADLTNAAVFLRGKAGNENRSFAYNDLDFPLRATGNDFLPRLWASRRVGWLVEEIRVNGETKELRDEVVELGTRYGIVTPYTSYLATDGTFQYSRRDASGVFMPAPSQQEAMKSRSGAGAVQMSVQQNTMKANTQISVDGADSAEQQVIIRNTTQNQFVANKNFFNQSGVWVDADYKQDSKATEVVVKFGSDEYFELAAREPGLAQYLALGEEVVVTWNNRVYRIVK